MKTCHKTSRLCCMLSLILVLSSAAGWTYALEPESPAARDFISIYIDGVQQEYDVPAQIRDGAAYAPMRPVFESVGAEVSWNAKTTELTATAAAVNVTGEGIEAVHTDAVYLTLKPGAPYAYVNNVMVTLSSPPFIEDGTAYVPVRFINESLGYTVSWDTDQNRIDIFTEEAPSGKEDDNTSASADTQKKDEESASDTVTYEEAIRMGIQHSDAYVNAQVAADLAKDENEDLIVDYSYYQPFIVASKNQLKLKDQWTAMSVELLERQLGNDIKNQMDNITQMKQELAFSEKKADFMKEKLRVEKIKLESGMTSQFSYDSVRIEAEKAAADVESLKKKIEGSYITLNTALGLPTDSREDFEYAIKYEPVKGTDPDTVIRRSIGDDPYLWYADKQIELSQYNFSTYDYMVNYNLYQQSYSSVKGALTQAKLSKSQMEKQLKETIQNRYNQLEQLEKGYETALLSLRSAENAVENATIQYNAGTIIKLQMDEAKLAVDQVVNEIEKLQIQHAQMKALYETPYLYPGDYTK